MTTSLPTQYQWLSNLQELPSTIKEALALYGVQEIVGAGSNLTIIEWRDELNQAGVKISGFSDDDVAWCGLFAAIVTYRRKKKPKEVVESPLWARNWLQYGIGTDQPSLGDILVFKRNGGGHVGFYIGEDASHYHVLGGNQGNAVNIKRLEKARLLGARRPIYIKKPSSVKPYRLSSTGDTSTNEA